MLGALMSQCSKHTVSAVTAKPAIDFCRWTCQVKGYLQEVAKLEGVIMAGAAD